MTIGLKKVDQERRDQYVTNLRKKWDDVTAAMATFNEGVTMLRDHFEPTLAAYNSEVNDAREWAEGIASEAQGEYDDKSEAWQEGEKGQARQRSGQPAPRCRYAQAPPGRAQKVARRGRPMDFKKNVKANN